MLKIKNLILSGGNMETEKVLLRDYSCDDCESSAEVMINMEDNTVYLCEECWGKLKELWWVN
jgi:predicted nucleic acid-binding Zn ribbon protein